MRKKILVIDDDQDILDALKMSLESEGYDTRITPNGNHALKKVRIYKPDLILLDIMLSGCDGRDIASKIKKNRTLKHIPIVLISANSITERAALECGASAFLPKPFGMDLLFDIIQACLRKKAIVKNAKKAYE